MPSPPRPSAFPTVPEDALVPGDGSAATDSARDAFLARLFGQNSLAIKYDLQAMDHAVAELGLRHPAPRVVLVGGTNGKGTTSAALASMADALGWRTGLYTSPHLVSFRERIRIDGEALCDADCVRIGEALLDRFGGRERPAEGPRPLTFFEITTLLALVAFRERGPLDVVIVEVGMGGRLDATNALERDLVLLTGVDLDHQEYLGETLEAIAREKAGLVRPDVPALLTTTATGGDVLAAACVAAGRAPSLVDVPADAAPREQGIALAAAALRHLVSNPPGEAGTYTAEAVECAVARGAERLAWPGRQQRIAGPGMTLWIDGAHNPGSAAACARWLAATAPERPGPLAAVVGLSGHRQALEVLGPLLPHVASWHVTRPSSRGRDGDEVGEELRALGADSVAVHATAGDALRAARGDASDVLVVGSLYLVGDALHALGADADALHPWRRLASLG